MYLFPIPVWSRSGIVGMFRYIMNTISCLSSSYSHFGWFGSNWYLWNHAIPVCSNSTVSFPGTVLVVTALAEKL